MRAGPTLQRGARGGAGRGVRHGTGGAVGREPAETAAQLLGRTRGAGRRAGLLARQRHTAGQRGPGQATRLLRPQEQEVGGGVTAELTVGYATDD